MQNDSYLELYVDRHRMIKSTNPFPHTRNLKETTLKTPFAKIRNILGINVKLLRQKEKLLMGEIGHHEQFLLFVTMFSKGVSLNPGSGIQSFKRKYCSF